MTLKSFDIEGLEANKLGFKGLKQLINDFGKSQGVKEVIIDGGKKMVKRRENPC